MLIDIIAGARPNFMKIAPIIDAIEAQQKNGVDIHYSGFSKLKTTIDKGHAAQFKLLVDRVQKGGAPLVPFEEAVNTTLASFAAIESLLTRRWVNID